MPAVIVSQFNGLIPQLSPRLLPAGNAEVANNVKLLSGEISALHQPKFVTKPIGTSKIEAMYLARSGDSSAWFSWDKDVDVVRAPLGADIESRFYWTGDGELKSASFSQATSSSINDYPSLSFAVGVSAPKTQPTVAVSGGVGSIITRFYCYTYFSASGEESPPSPVSDTVNGNVDGSFAVSGMDDFPANNGTATASVASGITSFTSSAYHWLRAGDEIVIAGQTVVVSSVISNYAFTVAGSYPSVTAWARKTNWNTAGMKRRLYRTTGSLGTFQLVNDDVGTSYTDTITDANILGDELISIGWVDPSPKLKGLIVHASGALVAFYGNQLCFSEPYQPHAWPKAYQLSTDSEIVGIATYGSEIVVTTKGNPYIASGVDPASMTMQKVEGMYPCLSKRSVVGIGYGVLYASTHGLVYLGNNGVSIFTKQFFTKDDWAIHNPQNMICDFAYGRVYLATHGENNQRYMMVFDDAILTMADVQTYDIYTDTSTGTLYVSTDEGINEWDAHQYPLLGSWKSKKYIFPNPMNLGAAKIEFDQIIDPDLRAAILNEIATNSAANISLIGTGNLKGSYNSFSYNDRVIDGNLLKVVPDVPPQNFVTFILWSNNKIIFSKTIDSSKAFRLPAGYKSYDIEFQVNSQCTVSEVRIAETMTELKQV